MRKIGIVLGDVLKNVKSRSRFTETSKNFVKLVVLVFLIQFLLSIHLVPITSAKNLNTTNITSSKKINVICTIPDFMPIVKAIGGKYVKVSCVMPPGCDPHAFTVSINTIQNLSKADLIILADSKLISFENRIKTNFKNKCMDINDYKKFGLKLDNFSDYKNCPHGYWLKLDNGIAIAKAIENRLSKLDPKNTAYFENNLKKFEKDVEITKENILKNSKVKGYYCVAAVPGVCYIAENSGMKVGAILMEESAGFISGGKLSKIENMMNKNIYKCILLPAFMKNTKVGEISEQISRDCGKPIVYVKFVMARKNDTYTDIAYYNAKQLNSCLFYNKQKNEPNKSPDFTIEQFVIAIMMLGFIRYIRR